MASLPVDWYTPCKIHDVYLVPVRKQCRYAWKQAWLAVAWQWDSIGFVARVSILWCMYCTVHADNSGVAWKT
jgi:hypothetical protein